MLVSHGRKKRDRGQGGQGGGPWAEEGTAVPAGRAEKTSWLPWAITHENEEEPTITLLDVQLGETRRLAACLPLRQELQKEV